MIFLGTKLKPNSAYMLRNDGTLFELGRDVNNTHPYVKYNKDYTLDDILTDIESAPDPIFLNYMHWILKHTKSKDTQTMVKNCLVGLAEYIYNTMDTVEAASLLDKLDIDYNKLSAKSWTEADTNRVMDNFNICNNLVNQEFCRVRVGDQYKNIPAGGDAYFRISSTGFDWFPLIYEVIHISKRNLDTITICRDLQSTGLDTIYQWKGSKIDHMPIDEFLTLSGNPVIEQYKNKKKLK